MKIHPTAIIHPKAELDEGVVVEPYAVIGEHVQIGKNTIVGPHCVIDGRTVIGENNQFFSGAQIGILCQDLKHKKGLIGRTHIGNDNMIREHVTVSASTMETYDDDHRMTTVGNNCLFMTGSHIAHDCHVGSYVIINNYAALAGHVDVEDRVILSGWSGVHQECVVGTMAFVCALTPVRKDVPPFMIVDGNPARCCGPNDVGLRRNGLTPEERHCIKRMYKIMYRSSLNVTQALHEIEACVEECSVRNLFLDFYRKSIRGVIA